MLSFKVNSSRWPSIELPRPHMLTVDQNIAPTFSSGLCTTAAHLIIRVKKSKPERQSSQASTMKPSGKRRPSRSSRPPGSWGFWPRSWGTRAGCLESTRTVDALHGLRFRPSGFRGYFTVSGSGFLVYRSWRGRAWNLDRLRITKPSMLQPTAWKLKPQARSEPRPSKIPELRNIP